MGTVRRRHSSAFKAKVALEALKGEKRLNELAAEYGVHPVQIAQWKKHALEGMHWKGCPPSLKGPRIAVSRRIKPASHSSIRRSAKSRASGTGCEKKACCQSAETRSAGAG
jgi:transposase-like protein